jgi:hypothetical protein
MNKSINDKFELWSESRNLIDKAIYRIVNALRHVDPQQATDAELHILDSLIRAIEYLEDVKLYRYKIRKQLYHLDRTIRALKKQIREDATVEIEMPDRFLWSLEPKGVRFVQTILPGNSKSAVTLAEFSEDEVVPVEQEEDSSLEVYYG